ncbi:MULTISPECIES: hypothetical protein [unclassified Mesotoga]|uniref:hypothetical protein n=1 Tax=unclassified Mesotoga TaxID=1184398 RepID=UPI0025D0EE29|nr:MULTISPECIES: hypothetical protein [unclassified Mesotoga]
MIYYVDDSAKPAGEHEIHTEHCERLREVKSKTMLGDFVNCFGALQKARDFYQNVDGCAYCCSECHKD